MDRQAANDRANGIWAMQKIDELIIPQAGKIRFIRAAISDWGINPEMVRDWTQTTIEATFMGLVDILNGLEEDLGNIPDRFLEALREREKMGLGREEVLS